MPTTNTDRIYGENASVAVKAPVMAVSNGTALALVGLTPVGTYVPNEGDRILVKDQADPTTNGIYNASASAWQRSGDFDGPYDVVQGTLVIANLNNGQWLLFQLSTSTPIIGTTPLNFVPFWAPQGTDYPQTAAEAIAGIVPTNLNIPDHMVIGGCLLERYGGSISAAAAVNDTAFANALLVAGQVDCPILITAGDGVWSFSTAWTLTGTSQTAGGPPAGALGARVRGFFGRTKIQFNGISNAVDCVTLGSIIMPQVELRDLNINFNATGRDGLVIIGSSFPIYENLLLQNCARDSDVCSVTGVAFVQNRTVRNVYVYKTGRHARRFQLAGAGGAFINEELTENFDISGVAALVAGGTAVYMTSTGTGAGAKFANHKYSKISWDCGYQSAYLPGGQLPAVSPFWIDSGVAQNIVVEGGGGWENTGAVNPGAGYSILITGTGAVGGFTQRAGLVTNSFWGIEGVNPAIGEAVAEETSFNRETHMPMTVQGNDTSGVSLASDYTAIRTGNATSPGPLPGQDAEGCLINQTSNTGVKWQQWNGDLVIYTSADPNSGAAATWSKTCIITAAGGVALGGGFSTVYSGIGAPGAGLGANGDYYFRQDTPGSANQRLYVKSDGAWTGII